MSTEDPKCAGASAYDTASFSPLGHDPGPADIQLCALSQDCQSGENAACLGRRVWVGGEGATRSYPWSG